jgi:hypothetical protein
MLSETVQKVEHRILCDKQRYELNMRHERVGMLESEELGKCSALERRNVDNRGTGGGIHRSGFEFPPE